jgi:hypothetical protein
MLRHCYEILFVFFAATLCLGCGQKRVVGPAPDMVAALDLRETLEKETGAEGKVEDKAMGTGWASLKGKFTFRRKPWCPESPRCR